jgi:hypothetical protein
MATVEKVAPITASASFKHLGIAITSITNLDETWPDMFAPEGKLKYLFIASVLLV